MNKDHILKKVKNIPDNYEFKYLDITLNELIPGSYICYIKSNKYGFFLESKSGVIDCFRYFDRRIHDFTFNNSSFGAILHQMDYDNKFLKSIEVSKNSFPKLYNILNKSIDIVYSEINELDSIRFKKLFKENEVEILSYLYEKLA